MLNAKEISSDPIKDEDQNTNSEKKAVQKNPKKRVSKKSSKKNNDIS